MKQAVLAFLIGFILAYLAGPALSQPQPPAYEPFSISQQEFENLTKYLGDQPLKFSEPLINFLRNKEAEAVEAKKKLSEKKE